LCYNKLP